MHEEALRFLASQRVGVIAIEMMDGAPHAATVHVANDGSTLIFETERQYRKAEPLLNRPRSRASVAIGWDEVHSQTLQLDGEVELIEKIDPLADLYLKKFPKKVEKAKEERMIFFKFTPSWWRFTDWTRPEGKTIYLSDGSVTVKK